MFAGSGPKLWNTSVGGKYLPSTASTYPFASESCKLEMSWNYYFSRCSKCFSCSVECVLMSNAFTSKGYLTTFQSDILIKIFEVFPAIWEYFAKHTAVLNYCSTSWFCKYLDLDSFVSCNNFKTLEIIKFDELSLEIMRIVDVHDIVF